MQEIVTPMISAVSEAAGKLATRVSPLVFRDVAPETAGMGDYATLCLPVAFIALVSLVHHGRTWYQDNFEYSVYQKYKALASKSKIENHLDAGMLIAAAKVQNKESDPLFSSVYRLFTLISDTVVQLRYLIFVLFLSMVLGEHLDTEKNPKSLGSMYITSRISITNALGITDANIMLFFFCSFIVLYELHRLRTGATIGIFVNSIFVILGSFLPAIYSFFVFSLLEVLFKYTTSYNKEDPVSLLEYLKSLIFTDSHVSNLSNYEFLYREAITHSISYSFISIMTDVSKSALGVLSFYILRRTLRLLYGSPIVSGLPIQSFYSSMILYAVVMFVQHLSKPKPKPGCKPNSQDTEPELLVEITGRFTSLSSRVLLFFGCVSLSIYLSWCIGRAELQTGSSLDQTINKIYVFFMDYFMDDFCLALGFYVVNFWQAFFMDAEKLQSVSVFETVADSFFLPFIYGSYKLSRYLRSDHNSILSESVADRAPSSGYHPHHHSILDSTSMIAHYDAKGLGQTLPDDPIHQHNATFQLALSKVQTGLFDYFLADKVRSFMYSNMFPVLLSNAFLPMLMITLGASQLLLGSSATTNNLGEVSKLENLILLAGKLGPHADPKYKISFEKGSQAFRMRIDPYYEEPKVKLSKKQKKKQKNKPSIGRAVIAKVGYIFMKTLLPLVLISLSSLLIYALATALTFSLHDKTAADALSWTNDQIFPIFYMFTYACSMPIAESFFQYRNSLYGYLPDSGILRFLVSLGACFGYYFLRRFVRKLFDWFGDARPWTNYNLAATFSFAFVVSFVYSAFGGPSMICGFTKRHPGAFALGILILALGYTIYRVKSWKPNDIALGIFDSVAFDIQYTLGFVILDLNSWLPGILRHDSLTGLGQSLNFALFEIVAVFSEFKYAKLFSSDYGKKQQ